VFKVLGIITIAKSVPTVVKIAKEILKTLHGFYIDPSCLYFIVTIHFYSLFMTWRLALPQMAMPKTILIRLQHILEKIQQKKKIVFLIILVNKTFNVYQNVHSSW